MTPSQLTGGMYIDESKTTKENNASDNYDESVENTIHTDADQRAENPVIRKEFACV